MEEEENSDLATGFSDPEESSSDDEEDEEVENRKDKDDKDEAEEEEEDAEQNGKKFYAAVKTSETSSSETNSFMELNLSRPLLRAVTKLQYQRPTPFRLKRYRWHFRVVMYVPRLRRVRVRRQRFFYPRSRDFCTDPTVE